MQLIIIGALNQDEIHKNFKKLKNIRVRIIDSINWSNLDILFSAICNFDIRLYPLLNTIQNLININVDIKLYIYGYWNTCGS